MQFDRHTFNAAILSLSPVHVARGIAPATFADIMACRDLAALPVWDGASDATIFGDARVNHAFRAWHDAHHIAGGHSFTLAGEIATMQDQQRALRKAFPCAPQWAYDILKGEVQGQAEYFAAHGCFPLDQVTFTMEYANVS